MTTQADLFDVSGKSALITGATGALGAVAARALAEARREAHAHRRQQTISSKQLGAELGDDVELVARRPDSEADTDAMVKAAVKAHGRVDILLTAAGLNITSPDPGPTGRRLGDGHGRKRPRQLARGAVPSAARCSSRATAGASFSSRRLAASSGHPAGYSAYCTSKSAIDGLTKSARLRVGTLRASRSTRSRRPCSAPTLTAWMYEDEDPGKSVREAMLARIPLGRLGEPIDLVGPLVFLCSHASRFVTGQILYVDGGYTAGLNQEDRWSNLIRRQCYSTPGRSRSRWASSGCPPASSHVAARTDMYGCRGEMFDGGSGSPPTRSSTRGGIRSTTSRRRGARPIRAPTSARRTWWRRSSAARRS